MTTFRATPELLNSLLTGIGPNYIKDGFLSFDRIKMETRDKTCTVKLYLEGVSLAVAEISPWNDIWAMCKYCGGRIGSPTHFCPHCGKDIDRQYSDR